MNIQKEYLRSYLRSSLGASRSCDCTVPPALPFTARTALLDVFLLPCAANPVIHGGVKSAQGFEVPQRLSSSDRSFALYSHSGDPASLQVRGEPDPRQQRSMYRFAGCRRRVFNMALGPADRKSRSG